MNRRKLYKAIVFVLVAVWLALLVLTAMAPRSRADVIRVPYDETLRVAPVTPPKGTKCWQIEDRQFDMKFKNFTPAHLMERDLLAGMTVHDAPTLICGGIVGGRFMYWLADQRWVDRGEPKGRGTGHKK